MNFTGELEVVIPCTLATGELKNFYVVYADVFTLQQARDIVQSTVETYSAYVRGGHLLTYSVIPHLRRVDSFGEETA